MNRSLDVQCRMLFFHQFPDENRAPAVFALDGAFIPEGGIEMSPPQLGHLKVFMATPSFSIFSRRVEKSTKRFFLSVRGLLLESGEAGVDHRFHHPPQFFNGGLPLHLKSVRIQIMQVPIFDSSPPSPCSKRRRSILRFLSIRPTLDSF